MGGWWVSEGVNGWNVVAVSSGDVGGLGAWVDWVHGGGRVVPLTHSQRLINSGES